METDVARNLREVKEALPEGVRLVAISKFHPSECIMEAYGAGQRVFGESREQELAAAFGVRSVPTLLFIPARGMPQMATGALPKETLREAIGELLLKLPAAES